MRTVNVETPATVEIIVNAEMVARQEPNHVCQNVVIVVNPENAPALQRKTVENALEQPSSNVGLPVNVKTANALPKITVVKENDLKYIQLHIFSLNI